MASAKANEFLIKQLNINKEIVTFRWLSRELSIHVNVAKNELAAFYASYKATNQHVHATYLLTGDVVPIKVGGEVLEDRMDGDEGNREIISTRKIILVGEDDLENAKGQFTHTPSMHIYCLSPAAVTDVALLGAIADRVRPTDVSKGKAYNQSVGIVTGYVGKPKGATLKPTKAQPVISSSKVASAVASKPAEVEANAPEKAKPEEKKTGTLDWSKAKLKADKKEAELAKKTKEIIKTASKVKVKEENGGNLKPNIKAELDAAKSISKKSAEVDILKRGTKRPSGVMSLSDSEDDRPFPSTKRRLSTPLPVSKPSSREKGVRVKRGVLLSDDEYEKVVQEIKSSKKGKGRALVSDNEDVDPSLRAMMDLDDTQVNRTTREPVSESEPVSDQDEDVEMLPDVIPSLPKQKRKPKKVIPVGKNGLPKTRVVKSRKTKNAKGYLVTEDYSSYESVSESEQPPAPLDTEKKQTKEKHKVKVKGGITKGKKEDEELSSKKLKTSKEKPEILKSTSSKIAARGASLKKLPESDGDGSKETKASNGGKNLMSYFKKK
ncbi:DNA polymerase subunit Cdc27 [Hysterangium stoloniferum]|nr:DNA polymerase subunit Cdc27 [Hysterangium stoloniferum]